MSFYYLRRDNGSDCYIWCFLYHDYEGIQTREGLRLFLRAMNTRYNHNQREYMYEFVEVPASCVARIYPNCDFGIGGKRWTKPWPKVK